MPELDDIDKALDKVKGNKTAVKFKRDGRTKLVELTPKKTEKKLAEVSSETKYVLEFQSASEHTLFKPTVFGFRSFLIDSTYTFIVVVGMLVSIFTGRLSFDMLNGPVDIYHNVDSVIKAGIISLIGYAVLSSVDLGIMNLILTPALDGGRILFAMYGAIFRKPVDKKAEATITATGAIFMVVIMILVTRNDIQRYFL